MTDTSKEAADNQNALVKALKDFNREWANDDVLTYSPVPSAPGYTTGMAGGYMGEAADRIAALLSERDEADRRAGAAERRNASELADLKDCVQGQTEWLREAKAERGYSDEVSFDRVWAEVCAKADEADELRTQLQAARDAKARLPWREKDIQRGLILFRTSNNAHGYTNYSALSGKIYALPQAARDELAAIMVNMALGYSRDDVNANGVVQQWIEEARDEALEEAAKAAEEYELSAPDDDIELAESSTASLIVQDIRALKSTITEGDA